MDFVEVVMKEKEVNLKIKEEELLELKDEILFFD